MINQNQVKKRITPPQLSIIPEDKQLLQTKMTQKFSSSAPISFLSPKKGPSKETVDLYSLTSDQLKSSIQNDPFMRAKLKNLIKSSQKSEKTQKQVKSPMLSTKHKNKFQQLTNMQTVWQIEKQEKQKKQIMVQTYFNVINEQTNSPSKENKQKLSNKKNDS